MAANPDADWKSVGSIWLGHFRKILQVIDFIMVEAGGVEPPSEKARHEETTCVAGSEISADRFRTGESGGSLARLISAAGSGPKPLAYPAK